MPYGVVNRGVVAEAVFKSCDAYLLLGRSKRKRCLDDLVLVQTERL